MKESMIIIVRSLVTGMTSAVILAAALICSVVQLAVKAAQRFFAAA